MRFSFYFWFFAEISDIHTAEDLIHLVKPLKVPIGTIYDIDCTRFRNKMMENIDIVNFTVSDPNRTAVNYIITLF